MADSNDSEKTEQATDARREEFRKQGQVAHSRELASALVLLGAAGGMYVAGRFFFMSFFDLFKHTYGPDLVTHIRQGDILDALRFAGAQALFMILPVVSFAMFIGVASTVLQTGFLQVEDAFSPDFNKLNPIEGFKRVFSLRSLVEGLKSLLKMILIGVTLFLLLRGEFHRVAETMNYSIPELLVYLGSIMGRLMFGVGFIMLVLAGGDYFFQRWELERKMMMTKQEIKEETKQREGDPLIKTRIRRIQREMATRRMMDAIPKADVVITNPTHIAVVLKYDANLPAPQLVAKGADLIAEKIKAMAREHNIPIVENIPLARTIFKTLKIGQVIPRELFVAVAEVLSFVFRLRKKGKV
ncbi:MAG: flagellar biosynthesis protein FlhB [Bdellovibrionaceae bacterium]|nr:flagellar biosynthesis protein FlhB [Pseudobdellovibrionaceae bacterium]